MFEYIRQPIKISLDAIDPGEDVFVHHHLGLGDMIHCNGLVRWIASRIKVTSHVYLFCKQTLLEMTRWMYRDEPRIRLIGIDPRQKETPQVHAWLNCNGVKRYVSIGHKHLKLLETQHPELFFDELFYMQAGIPYSVRYSHCFWQRDLVEEERVFRKLAPGSDYVFVHDDPARGFAIEFHKPGYVVRNDISESIFHLGLLLERAREIHCMESSIRCMLESLDVAGVSLYYHNFRYPNRALGTATQLNWQIIDYSDPQFDSGRGLMIA
ncbi:MAG: hypothetical protein KDB03_04280 [Planctomycetales bacterium]|nr:hypothetical protein [Planctomycetales bacterium]